MENKMQLTQYMDTRREMVDEALADFLQERYGGSDFLHMTASMVYRKRMLNKLPEWYVNVKNGDYALQLLLAHKGKIGYINQPMAVYRIHKGGFSNIFTSKKFYFNSLNFLFKKFNQQTNYKYHWLIKKRMFLLFTTLLKKSIVEFLYGCYKKLYFLKALRRNL